MNFKVSPTLKNSVCNVLNRRGIPYQLDLQTETIQLDLSGEKFHKIVLRAKMEKLQQEENSLIPYVAKTELDDNIVMQEVGTAYVIK